jgi:hypothetical protein
MNWTAVTITAIICVTVFAIIWLACTVDGGKKK